MFVFRTMNIFNSYLIVFQLCIFAKNLVVGQSRKLNMKGLRKDLVFPVSAENTDSDLYVSVSPKCNSTFCENVKNYPTNLFHDILENGSYGPQYYQFFRTAQNLTIGDRISDKYNAFICPSIVNVVYPRAAYNVKKQLKLIYNIEGYRQAIAIEICTRKSQCKFYDNLPNIRTKCKQKFVERRLLTADQKGRPYVDRYRFPSACSCSYKNLNNYSRFSTMYT